MRIAIIDDDASFRKTLQDLLERVFQELGIQVRKFSMYETAYSFFRDFKYGDYDLILLDIYMSPKDYNGVQLAEKIRDKEYDVPLVFCSYCNEFSEECFALNISHYIRKPITKEKIVDMINHLHLIENQFDPFLHFPDDQKVDPHKIIYTDYHDHYVYVNLVDGKRIRSRLSQGEMKKMLNCHKNFYVFSRGTIVNMAYILEIKKDHALLIGDNKVYFSKKKRKPIKKAFYDYCFL